MAVFDELVVKISGDIKDFNNKMNAAAGKMKDTGEKMKKIGSSMSKYVTLAILAAGTASVKMASDFDESLNKVDVAFKDSSKDIKAWAKTTLTNFGIAEGSALDMAALFGDMATSMGLPTDKAAEMSKSIVGLAGDLASFKNVGIDQAMTALNGVFTGETESLKRLGIVMTEANLAAFALSKGITKNVQDMTQAEKVNLRYAYVMQQTTSAQGDFARTGGGAANQMRVFKESLKQLGVMFGQVILPTFTKIITKINEWIARLQQMSPVTQKIVVVVAALAAAIGPLLFALGTLTSVIIPKMVAGGVAIAGAWLPITAVILGVVAAISIFNAKARENEKIIESLSKKSTRELELRLSVLQKKQAGLDSSKVKKLKQEVNALNEEAKKFKFGDEKMTELMLKRSALIKEINAETDNAPRKQRKIAKEIANEIALIVDILNERKKAEEEARIAAEEAAKAAEAAINNADTNVKSLTRLQYAQQQLNELIKKRPTLIFGDEILENERQIARLIERIKELQGFRSTESPLQPIIGSFDLLKGKMEEIAASAKVSMQQLTESINTGVQEIKTIITDLSGLITDVAIDSFAMLGDSIGKALSGQKGNFGQDFLLMVADWANKLGQILVAAGLSVFAAQTQMAINPLGAVVLGGALIAAAAAVKSAANLNGGGASVSSSQPSQQASGFNLFGMRNLRPDFNVVVTGEIVADGSNLRTILRNEDTRRGL